MSRRPSRLRGGAGRPRGLAWLVVGVQVLGTQSLVLQGLGCASDDAATGSSTGQGSTSSGTTTTTGSGSGEPERFEVIEGRAEDGDEVEPLATATFEGYATALATTEGIVALGTTLGVSSLTSDGALTLALVGSEPNLPAEVGLVHAMAPTEVGVLVASDTGIYVATEGVVTRSAGHDLLDPLGVVGLAARVADDDDDGLAETTLVLRTDEGLRLLRDGVLEAWSVEGESGAPSAAFATKATIHVAWGDRVYAIDRAAQSGVRLELPLGSVREIACSTAACGEGAVVYFATHLGLAERTDDDRYQLYTLADEGIASGGVLGFAFDPARQRLFAVTPTAVLRARTAVVPQHAFSLPDPASRAVMATDKLGDLWIASDSWATKLATGTPLSFATDVRPVMAAYCAGCHGQGTKGAPKLDFESFDVMVELVDRVIERIQDGSMPPSTYPALPAEQLQILIDWAETKAP